MTVPNPPYDLANRVGSLEEATDPYAYFDALGAQARRDIISVLPPEWSPHGKRVLDFGCGAGRTLRHFVQDADSAEIWGCDIDEESERWLQEHLSPPLHIFRNDTEPPLDQPDRSFDLIYAVSVFTHLVENSSAWLLELRRILKDDGLLVITFMGEGMSNFILAEDWHESRIGMNVTNYAESWDVGGPMVMHSPWWLRAHWSRAFDVMALTPLGFGGDPRIGHGTVVLRKRPGRFISADLDALEIGEEREAVALEHNRRLLFAEIGELRRLRDHLTAELSAARAAHDDSARREATLVNSRSWRMTAPLRNIALELRRRGNRASQRSSLD